MCMCVVFSCSMPYVLIIFSRHKRHIAITIRYTRRRCPNVTDMMLETQLHFKQTHEQMVPLMHTQQNFVFKYLLHLIYYCYKNQT